jgi:hypothetical protein
MFDGEVNRLVEEFTATNCKLWLTLEVTSLARFGDVRWTDPSFRYCTQFGCFLWSQTTENTPFAIGWCGHGSCNKPICFNFVCILWRRWSALVHFPVPSTNSTEYKLSLLAPLTIRWSWISCLLYTVVSFESWRWTCQVEQGRGITEQSLTKSI